MNLKGGYKIISLMAITLIAGAVGSDRTAITDKGILEQLYSLKEFLDESKQLKPILLRVKDSGNEVVMANLSKKTGEDIFYINADLVDASLNIMIKFAQNEETLEYYIDEAGYLYIADVDKIAGEVAKAEDGTIVKVLGLDANGELVKNNLPASGTKLYKHEISLSYNDTSYEIVIISNESTSFASLQKEVNCIINGWFKTVGAGLLQNIQVIDITSMGYMRFRLADGSITRINTTNISTDTVTEL